MARIFNFTDLYETKKQRDKTAGLIKIADVSKEWEVQRLKKQQEASRKAMDEERRKKLQENLQRLREIDNPDDYNSFVKNLEIEDVLTLEEGQTNLKQYAQRTLEKQQEAEKILARQEGRVHPTFRENEDGVKTTLEGGTVSAPVETRLDERIQTKPGYVRKVINGKVYEIIATLGNLPDEQIERQFSPENPARSPELAEPAATYSRFEQLVDANLAEYQSYFMQTLPQPGSKEYDNMLNVAFDDFIKELNFEDPQNPDLSAIVRQLNAIFPSEDIPFELLTENYFGNQVPPKPGEPVKPPIPKPYDALTTIRGFFKDTILGKRKTQEHIATPLKDETYTTKLKSELAKNMAQDMLHHPDVYSQVTLGTDMDKVRNELAKIAEQEVENWYEGAVNSIMEENAGTNRADAETQFNTSLLFNKTLSDILETQGIDVNTLMEDYEARGQEAPLITDIAPPSAVELAVAVMEDKFGKFFPPPEPEKKPLFGGVPVLQQAEEAGEILKDTLTHPKRILSPEGFLEYQFNMLQVLLLKPIEGGVSLINVPMVDLNRELVYDTEQELQYDEDGNPYFSLDYNIRKEPLIRVASFEDLHKSGQILMNDELKITPAVQNAIHGSLEGVDDLAGFLTGQDVNILGSDVSQGITDFIIDETINPTNVIFWAPFIGAGTKVTRVQMLVEGTTTRAGESVTLRAGQTLTVRNPIGSKLGILGRPTGDIGYAEAMALREAGMARIVTEELPAVERALQIASNVMGTGMERGAVRYAMRLMSDIGGVVRAAGRGVSSPEARSQILNFIRNAPANVRNSKFINGIINALNATPPFTEKPIMSPLADDVMNRVNNGEFVPITEARQAANAEGISITSEATTEDIVTILEAKAEDSISLNDEGIQIEVTYHTGEMGYASISDTSNIGLEMTVDDIETGILENTLRTENASTASIAEAKSEHTAAWVTRDGNVQILKGFHYNVTDNILYDPVGQLGKGYAKGVPQSLDDLTKLSHALQAKGNMMRVEFVRGISNITISAAPTSAQRVAVADMIKSSPRGAYITFSDVAGNTLRDANGHAIWKTFSGKEGVGEAMRFIETVQKHPHFGKTLDGIAFEKAAAEVEGKLAAAREFDWTDYQRVLKGMIQRSEGEAAMAGKTDTIVEHLPLERAIEQYVAETGDELTELFVRARTEREIPSEVLAKLDTATDNAPEFQAYIEVQNKGSGKDISNSSPVETSVDETKEIVDAYIAKKSVTKVPSAASIEAAYTPKQLRQKYAKIRSEGELSAAKFADEDAEKLAQRISDDIAKGIDERGIRQAPLRTRGKRIKPTTSNKYGIDTDLSAKVRQEFGITEKNITEVGSGVIHTSGEISEVERINEIAKVTDHKAGTKQVLDRVRLVAFQKRRGQYVFTVYNRGITSEQQKVIDALAEAAKTDVVGVRFEVINEAGPQRRAVTKLITGKDIIKVTDKLSGDLGDINWGKYLDNSISGKRIPQDVQKRIDKLLGAAEEIGDTETISALETIKTDIVEEAKPIEQSLDDLDNANDVVNAKRRSAKKPPVKKPKRAKAKAKPRTKKPAVAAEATTEAQLPDGEIVHGGPENPPTAQETYISTKELQRQQRTAINWLSKQPQGKQKMIEFIQNELGMGRTGLIQLADGSVVDLEKATVGQLKDLIMHKWEVQSTGRYDKLVNGQEIGAGGLQDAYNKVHSNSVSNNAWLKKGEIAENPHSINLADEDEVAIGKVINDVETDFEDLGDVYHGTAMTDDAIGKYKSGEIVTEQDIIARRTKSFDAATAAAGATARVFENSNMRPVIVVTRNAKGRRLINSVADDLTGTLVHGERRLVEVDDSRDVVRIIFEQDIDPDEFGRMLQSGISDTAGNVQDASRFVRVYHGTSSNAHHLVVDDAGHIRGEVALTESRKQAEADAVRYAESSAEAGDPVIYETVVSRDKLEPHPDGLLAQEGRQRFKKGSPSTRRVAPPRRLRPQSFAVSIGESNIDVIQRATASKISLVLEQASRGLPTEGEPQLMAIREIVDKQLAYHTAGYGGGEEAARRLAKEWASDLEGFRKIVNGTDFNLLPNATIAAYEKNVETRRQILDDIVNGKESNEGMMKSRDYIESEVRAFAQRNELSFDDAAKALQDAEHGLYDGEVFKSVQQTLKAQQEAVQKKMPKMQTILEGWRKGAEMGDSGNLEIIKAANEIITNPAAFDPNNTTHLAVMQIFNEIEKAPSFPIMYRVHVTNQDGFLDIVAAFTEGKHMQLTPATYNQLEYNANKLFDPTGQFGKTREKDIYRVVYEVEDAKAIPMSAALGPNKKNAPQEVGQLITAGEFRVEQVVTNYGERTMKIKLVPVKHDIVGANDIVARITENLLRQEMDAKLAKVNEIDRLSRISTSSSDPIPVTMEPTGSVPPENTNGANFKTRLGGEKGTVSQIDSLRKFIIDFKESTNNLLGQMTKWGAQGPMRTLVNTLNPSALYGRDLGEMGDLLGGFLRKKNSYQNTIEGVRATMQRREDDLFHYIDNQHVQNGKMAIRDKSGRTLTPELIVTQGLDGDIDLAAYWTDKAEAVGRDTPQGKKFLKDGENLRKRREEWIKLAQGLLDEQLDLEIQASVPLEKLYDDDWDSKGYFHNESYNWKSKKQKEQWISSRLKGKVEYGREFHTRRGYMNDRVFNTMQDGIEHGIKYAEGATENIIARLRAGQSAILDKEVLDILGGLTGDDAEKLQDLVTGISRQFGHQPNDFVRIAEGFNQVARPLMTTFDLGYLGLQAVPTALTRPYAAIKGFLFAMDSLTSDGRRMAEWYARQMEDGTLVDFFNHGGIFGQTELGFEEASKNRVITKLGTIMQKEPTGLVKFGVGTVGGRFQNSYVNMMNVLAIENYKAVMHLTNGWIDNRLTQTMSEALRNAFKDMGISKLPFFKDDEPLKARKLAAAAIANKMTFRVNSEMIGVSAFRRATETATLFAPKYYRGFFGLLGDSVLRGGVAGAEARKALGGMVGSFLIFNMLLEWRTGNSFDITPFKEIDGEMRMNPEFLRMDIGGVRVAPGGPLVNLIRLAAKIGQDPSALKNLPIKDGNLDLSQNPLTRWAQGKMSPAAAILIDTLHGHTFTYDEFNPGKPTDWAKRAGSYLPFSITAAVDQYKESGSLKDAAIAGGIEFGIGGTTFPVPARDTFKLTFKEKTGEEWNASRPLHRQIVEEDEELSQLKKEWENDVRDRFDNSSTEWKAEALVWEETPQDEQGSGLLQLAENIDLNDPLSMQEWSRARGKTLDGIAAIQLKTKGNFDEDEEPTDEFAKLAKEYYSIRASDFSPTGVAGANTDWELYEKYRERVLKKMEDAGYAEDAQIIRDHDVFQNELINKIDKRWKAARDARDALDDLPKYKGLDAEQEGQVEQLLESAERIAQIRSMVGPKTVYASDILGGFVDAARNGELTGEFLRPAITAWFASRNKTKDLVLSDARAETILDNPDLAMFYKSLWRELTKEQREEWIRRYPNLLAPGSVEDE